MIRLSHKTIIIIFVFLLAIFVGLEIRQFVADSYEKSQSVISKVEWKPVTLSEVSLSYPDSFSFERGSELSGGYLLPTVGKISFARDAFRMDNSNYVNSFVVIGRSENPEDLRSCKNYSDIAGVYGQGKLGNKTVGNITFSTQTAIGAAAGNLYESRLFRTVHRGICYELALTVHTGNIHNYPEGSVVEFDRERAFVSLERIVDTFKILQ